MSDAPKYGFDTLQVHAGNRPDPATGARQVPIYQTTAYVFDDADHAAALFNLQTVGFIYSRLTNPTNAALETRLATLEGGRGCTVASSGHAAQVLALFPLMSPGAEIVASDGGDRGTNPRRALAYTRLRQTDDVDAGQQRADADLDLDDDAIYADERGAGHARHARAWCRR